MTPSAIKKHIYKNHKVPFLSPDFIVENKDRKDVRWDIYSLNEALYSSLATYSLPHLLRFEDKNSMRFSIESRVPFLDYRLVEYMFSMSPGQKIHEGTTKYAFRQAMEGDVPSSILSRHDKIGFATPEDKWLKEEGVRDFINQIIDSESFQSRDYWNWEMVRSMYEKLLEGKSSSIFVGTEIWRCISVELWMRLFIDNKGCVAE